MLDERCIRRKVGAPREFLLRGCAQQVEAQVDARTPAANIVLQLGVQALVAQVKLGSQRDQQHFYIER